MSDITCGIRFPGMLNQDLRKLAVNLVPFPRVHFVVCSVVPLGLPVPLNIQEFIQQAFDAKSFSASVNPYCGFSYFFLTPALIMH